MEEIEDLPDQESRRLAQGLYGLEAVRFARSHRAFVLGVENSLAMLLANPAQLYADSPALLPERRTVMREMAFAHGLYCGAVEVSAYSIQPVSYTHLTLPTKRIV
eukprot:TRINITY_DN1464_c0_g1_i2.p1 TRINITY_DN1464_c0_g1~~TRINITY_DN1464_c0_g1_i2.p1  ORF type:complete len:105 (+),score=18.39 TRINITY_DN1464_c0_g1_i2:126-440(+)